MSKTKKNKQRNGFYFYMKDLLEDYQKQGKNEYNMQTIATVAHPLWKNLSQEEKEEYNHLAKKIKEQSKETYEGKLDCTGQPIQLVMKEEREREQQANAKLRAIKCLIKELTTKPAIANEHFYIISFNIFCLTEEGEYVPAEVGLVEYSIAKGIMREYHEFIDPGCIPIGYQFTAVQHSEDTHKIPTKDFSLSNKNYMFIYRSIKTFMCTKKNPNSKLYCFPDEVDQTEGVLDWLSKHSLAPSHEMEVYDLAALLLELRQFASKSYVETHQFAKDILTKNVFDYVPNISCPWHEEQDVPNHCALGIAKRYCYLMSDYLCKAYNIEMIPNKHIPVRDDSENISIIDPLSLKFSSKLRPLKSSSESKPTMPQTTETKTIVSSLPSKYSTEHSKMCITGSEPAVRTEVHRIDPKLPKLNQPSSNAVSVASIVRGPSEDFQLENEDFPSLESLSLGRGRGRGLFALSNQTTKLKTAGLGRGFAWNKNE